MKTCPLCHHEYEDDRLFCQDDGASLRSIDETVTPSPLADQSLRDEPGTAVSTTRTCPMCAADYPLTFARCPVDDHELVVKEKSASTQTRAASKVGVGGKVKEKAGGSERNEVKPKPVESLEPSSEPLDHLQSPSVTATDGRLVPGQPKRVWFYLAALILILAGAAYPLLMSTMGSEPDGEQLDPVDSASAFIPTPEPGVIDTAEETEDESDRQAVAREPEAERLRPPISASAAGAGPALPTVPRREAEKSAPAPPRPPTSPAPSRAEPAREQAAQPAAPITARLVRARSRKAGSGYHYDLTFTLRDPAGREVNFEQLTIYTRSSSGRANTETLPFRRRLAAGGGMTFTINPTLTGSVPRDWEGDVSVTAIGRDAEGRLVRASMSASVSP